MTEQITIDKKHLNWLHGEDAPTEEDLAEYSDGATSGSSGE